MWAVFKVTDRDFAGAAGEASGRSRPAEGKLPRPKLTDVLDPGEGSKGVVTRGLLRPAGDARGRQYYMLWWVAPTFTMSSRRCTSTSGGPGSGTRPSPCGPPVALHRAARVQQGPHPRVPRGRGAEELHLRLPLRPLVRVVPPRPGRAQEDDGRARHDGARIPGRAGQHDSAAFRAERLRVDARLRGRRAPPDRRPHASPAVARRRGSTRVEIPFYTGRRKCGRPRHWSPRSPGSARAAASGEVAPAAAG